VSDTLDILLTNDDGIDASGLRALHDVLSERWNVTAVAPTEDRSGAGLTMNNTVTVERHDLGYAVEGTPADCVEVAIGGLAVRPDLVVSGCNPGPNIGAHTLGRSGTVGAATEASIGGTPAIAVSLYEPDLSTVFPSEDPPLSAFTEAARVTEYLVESVAETGDFGGADYLNVVVPLLEEGERSRMRITRPSETFEIYPTRSLDESLEDDGEITFRDIFWEGLVNGEVDDPVGTDRRAVADGETSVSPLSLVHEAGDHAFFEEVAERYGELEG